MRKLFVANLPDFINEDVLRQLFEATGGLVTEISVPRDHATGWPRGFAFLSMSSDREAQVACNELDGSFQGGRSIVARLFQDPPRKTGETASFRVVVREDSIKRVELLLREADIAGTIRSGAWMGVNGYFWWHGPAGAAIQSLALAIGGEPMHEGESFQDAKKRLK